MNRFAEKATAVTGTVQRVEGKGFDVDTGEDVLSFTAEGDVAAALMPGHEVTVVTWGSTSALRVVDHTDNMMYRPYYHADPESDLHLPEAHRTPADVADAHMSPASLLPTVALATLYQSIPVYGWVVTYKMAVNPDKSIRGTAPQYEQQSRWSFVLFVMIALLMAGATLFASGSVLKAVLVYMTLLYVGTFLLMRYIFKGIAEIDSFTRAMIARGKKYDMEAQAGIEPT